MRKVLPFILCGGAGTRLWPLSREAYPKQFHRLTGQETLFQETCRRFSSPLFGDPFVLANHRYRFLIAEQMEAADVPDFLIEVQSGDRLDEQDIVRLTIFMGATGAIDRTAYARLRRAAAAPFKAAKSAVIT